jgi:hypothetical protein
MIKVRPSEERGKFELDWLKARHTFSFNRYYDPNHMQYRALRVINEDVFGGGGGFGMHPHDNMEILTYVLSGSLAHKDSTGGVGTIGPHEIQRMSAGTGIMHSEFNASKTEPVHLFQVWIYPEKNGLEPGYEQKRFSPEEHENRFRLLAAREPRDGSVKIHQDVEVFVGGVDAGRTIEHPLGAGRHGWVQVASGKVRLNGVELSAGDAAALSEETAVRVEGIEKARVLLFDLA